MNRWDKETYDAAQKDQEEFQASLRPDAKKKPSRDRASIAEQAKALLEGKDKWRPMVEQHVWEDVGEAIEVEKDVTLPRD